MRVMKTFIELGSEGARRAARRGDIVVLIDALRASTTIACALAAGASRVIPALTVEEALALRQQHGYLLAGERGGAKIGGFDFGNSPTELLAHRDELSRRPLVLTTSNGTRCVRIAQEAGAPAILAAAPPNAHAAMRAASGLARHLNRDITLLAAGLDDQPNDEDAFTAQALRQILEHDFGVEPANGTENRVDPCEGWRVFTGSEAGGRLTRLGYEADVAFCAKFDLLDIAPIYRDELGFVTMKPEASPGRRPE